MSIIQLLQEENSLLRSELKGLANSMSDITALVETLRTQLAAPDSKLSPTLDHAHLEKLESVVRADSQRSVILQALKKEVTELHKELAFLKERLRGTLPLVHQDGPSQAAGRDIAKDGTPSTRREATVRSAGQCHHLLFHSHFIPIYWGDTAVSLVFWSA